MSRREVKKGTTVFSSEAYTYNAMRRSKSVTHEDGK
jgi:hypothetical protein